MANLLIVDDNENILDAYAFHFRSIGWSVEIARNGKQCIALVDENRTFYHGIILDKNMPAATGDDVVRWLFEQELLDEICVVLFTGFPEMKSAIDALRMGAWQYLVKDGMSPTEIQSFIAPGIAKKLIARMRRDLWVHEELERVLDRIQVVVKETLAPDGFHVIFLSPFLSVTRDLSDGSRPSADRVFVKQILGGAQFVYGDSKAKVQLLEPVDLESETLMAVPVNHAQEVLGVLVMECRKERAFDPRWQEVLTYIAETISITQTIHRRVVAEQERSKAEQERSKQESLVITNDELCHRIKNSLTVIQQSAKDLSDKSIQPDAASERVSFIASHAVRINGVLDELGEITQVRPPNIESCDVTAIVRDVIREPRTLKADIRIEANLEAPAVAKIDREHFRDAVTCLVQNAYDAIDDRLIIDSIDPDRKAELEEFRYQISITLKQADEQIEIAVTDNGVGFKQDVEARLFNPLFSTKRRRGAEKRGLGLYSSQRVIKEMGGHITAMSEGHYKGATFTIHLNKARSE